MDEREELKQELQWVQYRQKMLDIIDEKLLQMKQLAHQAEAENLSPVELKALNEKINNLAEQVMAIDSESRKIEDSKILR